MIVFFTWSVTISLLSSAQTIDCKVEFKSNFTKTLFAFMN